MIRLYINKEFNLHILFGQSTVNITCIYATISDMADMTKKIIIYRKQNRFTPFISLLYIYTCILMDKAAIIAYQDSYRSYFLDIADEELMSEYSVNGCTKSFARLYNRHKAPVYRYFLRQTNAQSLAEELLQEVWIKIIKSAENYTQSAKFTTYLYKIARNILIDHLRKASTKTADLMINSDHDYENDLQDSNTNPELIAITSENSQKLLAAINHLPADQKEVFLLRVDAGLTFKEIAETTGCGHEAVKSRFRYAAKKLTYLVAEG